MKKYIAVDLGASNGRVIVGNLEGFEVTNRFPTWNIRLGDSVFWDILAIFNEIKRGSKRLLSSIPKISSASASIHGVWTTACWIRTAIL